MASLSLAASVSACTLSRVALGRIGSHRLDRLGFFVLASSRGFLRICGSAVLDKFRRLIALIQHLGNLLIKLALILPQGSDLYLAARVAIGTASLRSPPSTWRVLVRREECFVTIDGSL